MSRSVPHRARDADPDGRPALLAPRLGVHRRCRERGATAVEYALILALVVFATIASIELLGQRGSEEVVNQADCVSSRPPPPECQQPAITTTTTVVGSPIPSTTAPPPPPNPVTIGATEARTGGISTEWWLELDVEVTQPPPIETPLEPSTVAGATVEAQVVITAPAGPSFFVSCVTGDAGTCTLRFDVPFSDATEVRLEVTGAQGTDPVTNLPSPVLYPAPVP